MSGDFLVEIGTEELPPKALKTLAQAFRNGIEAYLNKRELDYESAHYYASPRRLAVMVTRLKETGPDRFHERLGPYLDVAFDEKGNPSKAAEGFAKANGTTVEALDRETDEKGERLVHREVVKGARATEELPKAVLDSLSHLPIPKRMSWGDVRDRKFVRPVHWVVMLYGDQVVDCEVMGHRAGNQSRGHRFHHPDAIAIDSPASYVEALRTAYVLVDFAERRERIRQSVIEIAETAGGKAVIDDDLLDEVTALNEWPVPLVGDFDKEFLEVPPEALISSMAEHQKYFHLIDGDGRLLPKFIAVANIESLEPTKVVAGNERVIRPRLADAAFFYHTDLKISQLQRREQLRSIVFQAQLGTLYEKTERIARLSEQLAPAVGADPVLARRAGELCKSDLVSEMVGEFADLQGTMGQYYARHDGEPDSVASAMLEHYLPRFAGDRLPANPVGTAVALADRIDTLTGIFGIGQPPSGSRDPFALRRASLGVLRILVEGAFDLDLRATLAAAVAQYGKFPDAGQVCEQVFTYVLDRFRYWYEEQNVPLQAYLSVIANPLSNPLDIHLRVQAVQAFSRLPEAAALAAANKRVSNILAKEIRDEQLPPPRPDLLVELAEQVLTDRLTMLEERVRPLLSNRSYTEALKQLATLYSPVNDFFDQVMVMVDDQALRNNRLALLVQLRSLFLEIADISLLAAAGNYE